MSLLDHRHALPPGLVSSIKSTDSVVLVGHGEPCELPIGLFQVLMAFAEPVTPRDAFGSLDVDVELEQFAEIVDELCKRGLLVAVAPSRDGPDLGRALAHKLGDAQQTAAIASSLRSGRAIVIRDALPAPFAEQVYQELDREPRWSTYEGGHDFFHYRNSALTRLDARGGALAETHQLFCSDATRRFVGELSGRDCGGPAHAAGAWYRPGDCALPHDDTSADHGRTVAYVWYLTKNWRREWGGSLFWGPSGQFVSPGFNVLVLFTAVTSNVHCVCPVSTTAMAKRLTINGFWHQATPAPTPRVSPPDAWISPPAYGTDAQIIVL